MTNVQQPEMRRGEDNPLVQESKRPDPTGRPREGGTTGPVPAGQASPYGPRRVVAEDDSEHGDAHQD